MHLHTRRLSKIVALGLILLLGLVSSTVFAEAKTATYKITITNLTTEGQPLTPPAVAIHRQSLELFEVGHPASFEVKEIAENGNLAPMVEFLGDAKHVFDSGLAGVPSPLLPGDSVTIELTSAKGAKYLSFVSMLICTNDGFTGANSLRLPKHVGDSSTHHLAAYDAGTEMNTEDFADMVPPCPALTGVNSDVPGTGTSDPALAENGVIHHHAGIQGGNDLVPALHGWENPVAMIEITRTD